MEAPHEPRLCAGDLSLLSAAAAAGLGIALLPAFACRERLESGELQRVLPEWKSADGAIHLVFTTRRGLLPGVRAVLDMLTRTLRADSRAWRLDEIAAPATATLAA